MVIDVVGIALLIGFSIDGYIWFKKKNSLKQQVNAIGTIVELLGQSLKEHSKTSTAIKAAHEVLDVKLSQHTGTAEVLADTIDKLAGKAEELKGTLYSYSDTFNGKAKEVTDAVISQEKVAADRFHKLQNAVIELENKYKDKLLPWFVSDPVEALKPYPGHINECPHCGDPVHIWRTYHDGSTACIKCASAKCL